MRARRSAWCVAAIVCVVAGCGPAAPGPSMPDAGPMREGDPAAPVTAGTTPGSAPSDGLPATAFVFERQVKRGDYWRSSLHTYDLATGSEGLVSDLGGQARINGLAVSSDHKSIAITTLAFHPSEDTNIRRAFLYGVLWSMRLDGTDLRRLTPPATGAENAGGRSCFVDQECPAEQECFHNYCYYSSYYMELTHPVWAPDGQSVFATEGILWGDIAFTLFPKAGTLPVSVPAAGGVPKKVPGSSCLGHTPVAFHPTQPTAAMGQSSCVKENEGFYELAGQPLATTRLLTRGPTLSSWSFSDSLLWWPDGSGLLFTAQNVRKKLADTPLHDRRQGLYFWDPTDGQYRVIYEPPADDLDIDDFAVSRDTKHLVVVVRVPLGNDLERRELHELDLVTRELRKLPIAGVVQRPRF
jgi:hypothetical protein